MTTWPTILPTRTAPAQHSRRRPRQLASRPPAPPWLVLCPPDAVVVRDPAAATVRALPTGTAVALVSDRPLSRRRLRRVAARAGVDVCRELVVVPSTTRAIASFDDTGSAVHHFWESVAAVPPGLTRSAGPATVALRLARAMPWAWTGALAPGRVVVGTRR
jgi:hypothetical protein